jgi:hypothetical protein
MSYDEVRDFLDEHGTFEEHDAVKFLEHGDRIVGPIINAPKVIDQQRQGQPPRRTMIINIQSDDDAKVYTLWVDRKTYLASAIADAVRVSGALTLYEGGTLKVVYDHDMDVNKPSPAKQYVVTYTPPSAEPF